MRFALFLSLLLFSLLSTASTEKSPLSYPDFRQMRVEAQTVVLQTSVILSSIQRHYQVTDSTNHICFDTGNIFVYIKLLDLAIDRADRNLFMNLSYQTRYNLRQPFMKRDYILGACGIVSDTTMPQGDFKTLERRIIELQERLISAIKEVDMMIANNELGDKIASPPLFY